MASGTPLRVCALPRYSKKLICANIFCRTLFASVNEKEPDLSFYVLNGSLVQNWAIKASPNQTQFPSDKAFPVMCCACKSEIGVCQNGKVTIFTFKIKSIVVAEINRKNGSHIRMINLHTNTLFFQKIKIKIVVSSAMWELKFIYNRN